ncbi:AMP-binding protein [Yimella sp. cx-51]|uniref:AMP-binding protein n=1 Tax=Yimella sp. cx-51 TaxID=2770551 RepID=UPI00165D38AE|nr:AMP-binding protein [Yimella sp. cx-51]MBC9958076.1 AMP-binding protein [Yimella sp. cx-51]QTH38878.1 AMP-binding protein [Yimella sp. cx-51]
MNDPQTIPELVSTAAERFGDRPAWSFIGVDGTVTSRWSFEQVDHTSGRIAGWVTGHSSPNARVAAMLPNIPEFPLLWLACAHSGRVLVPINSKSGRSDARHLLELTEPEIVVTTPDQLGFVAELLAELGSAALLVAQDQLPVEVCEDQHAAVDATPGRLVNIQFTSGTTGLPKGCMLTHTYWIQIARSLTTTFPAVQPDDVMYTAQAFSYLDPQWNVVTALFAGAHLLLADRFSASRMWDDLRRHRVTLFYCLGVMPAALLGQPPHPDDRRHSVRAVIASGIPFEQHADLESRWGTSWFEAFGMTESGADLIVSPDDHDIAVGTACLGRAHRGREVVLLDPEGQVLPLGSSGELAVRGVGLMDGYWRNPEATAAKFRDGWLLSGDHVRTDTEGRFYYVGRFKDMIRRSGENIAAREVERVLERHPLVSMAAVIGRPDEMVGEEVQAFVMPTQPHDPHALVEELDRWCSVELAGFKVPRYWSVRDTLPMTPSERVAKSRLSADSGAVIDCRPRAGNIPEQAAVDERANLG